MTMLDIFQKTIEEAPVDLRILSVKEGSVKSKLVVECSGQKTTIELSNTCTPKEEQTYCWQVLATAMSSIYIGAGDLEKGRLWLDAWHDKSLITNGL